MAQTEVVITKVFYKGTGRAQPDEYVEIANWGEAPADLSGWRLHDSGEHNRFTFPSGAVLAPRKRLRVYTNEIHPETGGFSFKRNLSVWNDGGDTATLVDAAGQPVSTWKYPGDEERQEPPPAPAPAPLKPGQTQPDDRQAGDYFGWSVALSGEWAIVGAFEKDAPGQPNAGAAYCLPLPR